MKRHTRLAGLFSLAAFASIAMAAASTRSDALFHERKEVAGLAVVFGAEPEPALTDEVEFLRWRVSSLADEQPYVDLEDAQVTIALDGAEFGPFALRQSRGDPSLYETRHVFTAVGEYDTVLTFRKGEEEQVHTVDFTFSIGDRSELEIPGRRHGG